MRPALSDYEHLASGKVRELYRIDDDHMLFVASDRISAFDYILDNEIPDKGRILTAMSVFFFDYTNAPNHLAGPADDPRIPDEVLGRALVVRKLDMIPVECVARGYLTGSGLLDYQKTGEVSGIALPPGLTEASKFDAPLFTPASKAELGEHDENISFADVIDMVGAERANELRDLTLATYGRAADHALTKGIIIADTKFEFGVDGNGDLVLADEVFTPDSSRYWAVDTYQEGVVQPSFDKQFVRNWLLSPESGWDRGGDEPPPPLPPDHRRRHPRTLCQCLRAHFGSELRRLDRSGRVSQTPVPPIAKRIEHRREHHGDVFVDPYEWLRDKSDPAVIEYLEAENAYTEKITDHLAPLRQKIFDEIKARTKETDLSVPTRRGDWWYYSRSYEGKQYGVHCRCPISDPDDWTPPQFDEHTEIPGEQVLLDENVEADGHDFFSMGAATVSVDAHTLAYSVDVRRRRAIHVAVQGLTHRPALRRRDRRDRRRRDVGGRQPDRLLHDRRRRVAAGHRVAAPHRLGPTRREGLSRARREVLARGGPHPQRQVPHHRRGQCGDVGDPLRRRHRPATPSSRSVWPRRELVEYSVEHAVVGGEDRFLILHNDGAENFTLVEAPVSDPTTTRTLIEHRDDVRLDAVDAFVGHIVVSYRSEALPRIQLWPLYAQGEYGRPEDFTFESELTSAGLSGNPNWDSPKLRIGCDVVRHPRAHLRRRPRHR